MISTTIMIFKKPMVYLLIFASTVSAGPRSPRVRFVSWELQGFRDEGREGRREKEQEYRQYSALPVCYHYVSLFQYLNSEAFFLS